ncbi:signal peptidase I [Paenibacillus sp. OV219]|uniref:signal peptidase I n=1 Tax=Paenibacillus sp. OV219 TaxID=1884377 RepID=UPI0008B3B6F3|nr:signal peptidase I [Paenibacillus sp. OV219]SEP03166.1 signal peptidase I [Paenibacillus sp. OV219]
MVEGPRLDTNSPQAVEDAPIGPRKRNGSPAKRQRPAIEPGKKDKLGRAAKKERNSPPWVAELRSWVLTLAIAVLIVFGMHVFVFNLSTVKGQSMEPTLYESEWLFINKFAFLTGSPSIGDVVILKDPAEGEGRKEFLVKRIVGLPGDTIEIREGQLYRNGQLVVESYTDTEIEDLDYGPDKINADHYFVMGDNRHAKASRDSRSFHAVPRSSIIGRADLIIWPIARLNHL